MSSMEEQDGEMQYQAAAALMDKAAICRSCAERFQNPSLAQLMLDIARDYEAQAGLVPPGG